MEYAEIVFAIIQDIQDTEGYSDCEDVSEQLQFLQIYLDGLQETLIDRLELNQ